MLDLVDLVCVMTVNPGYGGQMFIDLTGKIRAPARDDRRPAEVHIEIDGGVDVKTAPLVARAGADVLVAGSAVFRGGSVDGPCAIWREYPGDTQGLSGRVRVAAPPGGRSGNASPGW